MFSKKHPCTSWTFKYKGRGVKPDPVKAGCFVIEHVATGRVIVNASTTASESADSQIEMFIRKEHPDRRFQRQFDGDEELLITLFPCSGIREARRVALEVVSSVYPPYLLH